MSQPKDRQQIRVREEKAVLAAVHLPRSRFDERDPLGELRALAENAGSTVTAELVQKRDRPEPATFIGSGKLDELKAACEATGAGVIIFDNLLSPKQIANVEKVVERKVIDRCELILDIFASRATTHQAKLAVEYAQLEYTYPRLRAMWTHLERIVGAGGIGGVGTRGPGEQQLEIDRRLVQRRKVQLRRELDAIHQRKVREVQGRNRRQFTVGLVGYTNAGKSTLFNALTAGGAYADNRVFATLMSRTRSWDIGGGQDVMLSDTVGFIRDLPHHLIESFKATLEEATHADLLLVVLDVSDPAAELQYETVRETLDELFEDAREASRRAGLDYEQPETLLLLNKADRLPDNAELLVWQQRVPGAIPFCAFKRGGLGHDELYQEVRRRFEGVPEHVHVRAPLASAKSIHLLEQQGQVHTREYDGPDAVLGLTIGTRTLERLLSADPGLKVVNNGAG
jgi:GTP-binding protein HflX